MTNRERSGIRDLAYSTWHRLRPFVLPYPKRPA